MAIGELAAAALALGAEAIAKGVLGEAAKDAYKNLKNTLFGKAETTARSVIENPESKARIAALAEDIDKLSENERSELLKLVSVLKTQLMTDPDAQRTFGARIGELEAEVVKFGTVDASGHATGVDADRVKAQRVEFTSITAKGSEVGKR